MADCIPVELVWLKLHIGDLRVYAILDRLDIWDRGIVQASHTRLAALYESTPAIVGRHIRHLLDAGALELLYPGRYSGRTHDAGNTYRLVHKQAAAPAEQRAPTRAGYARARAQQLRAPTRAISSPTENPAPTRVDGFHRYPCWCEGCTERIEARRAPVRYDSDRGL
jgi:hypothetical protein